MTDVMTARISERLHSVRAPLGADEIMRMIPHRPPFVLLDRVIELDPPSRAVGLKAVTIAEPWFAGHFPGLAILPGVLVIECLAQLAGVLIAADCQAAGDQSPHRQPTAPGCLRR
jgi:3-hydroxyacyl-[acyl-carrier-protein] dehydratase